MTSSIGSIFLIGFNDGLIWFPLVLGIGFLFTYYHEIDISIDGNAILSGIICAYVWRLTNSYIVSICAGIGAGVFFSTIVVSINIYLGVPSLMAGVLFSLVGHSVSVLLVGESLILPDTHLVNSFGHTNWWFLFLVAFVAVATTIFYHTRYGVSLRKLGDGCTINTVFSAKNLKWTAYALSGGLYGLGGAIYAHSQGVAKSGGGFEFLLVSLCAYLCMDRLLVIFEKAVLHSRRISIESGLWRQFSNILLEGAAKVQMRAFIGAIAFETLLLWTIAVSPSPIVWKLIFALLLGIALTDWHKDRFSPLKAKNENLDSQGLSVTNLNVTYDIGGEKRVVYSDSDANFCHGVSLIVGPNGAGKSTFLKVIAGFKAPNSGTAIFRGSDLLALSPHERSCFLIHQNPIESLSENLSVVENLYAAYSDKRPWRFNFGCGNMVSTLTERLTHYSLKPIYPVNDSFWFKPVKTLSGGEAACVAVYCALMAKTPLLLADEPTTGLDQNNFEKFTELIKALGKEKIIILTSHDHRVHGIADCIYKIQGGQFGIGQ
jgi:ABC-type glutathione transport system ATPase component